MSWIQAILGFRNVIKKIFLKISKKWAMFLTMLIFREMVHQQKMALKTTLISISV